MYQAAIAREMRMPYTRFVKIALLVEASEGLGEGVGANHGYPQVDGAVVQKPVRECSLGTHHVRVLLRTHP